MRSETRNAILRGLIAATLIANLLRGLWLRFRGDAILMVLVVAWGFARLWPELDHESIWNFDESFHQVVTRHAFEHPLSPSLFDDPVHPETTDHYWGARAWLIKPPFAFWTGALMMHLVGKVPLAFRLGGFLSQLFAALVVYLAARLLAGRLWATLAAAGFLALPSGWILTQTQFVGDELDLQLCGSLTLSMVGLYFTVKKRSVGWAALSGAAMGAAFLVKFVLALTPIGVAGCLWGLSRARWCEGPRRRDLLVMALTSLAVALPWHLYAPRKWLRSGGVRPTRSSMRSFVRCLGRRRTSCSCWRASGSWFEPSGPVTSSRWGPRFGSGRPGWCTRWRPSRSTATSGMPPCRRSSPWQ